MFISGSSTSTGSFHELHIADRVGIGTSSPPVKLQINDSGTAPTAAGSGDYGTGFNVARSDGLMGMTMGYQASPQAFYIQGRNFTNTDKTTLLINPLGGNVGIGITNPSTALEIDGGIIQNTSNPFTQMIDTSSGGDTYGLNNNSSRFSIYNWTDAREELIFDGSGNVGIGTSPDNKLTISGNVTQIDGSPEYHLATSGASHYNWRIAVQEQVDGGFEIASGTQSAGTNANSDTYTNRFIILGDGKVGIGQTPSHNFNLRSSGNVEFRIQSTDDDARLQISSDNDEGQDSILEFLSNTSTRGSILYDHNTTAASQKMDFKVGDNAVTAMTILGNGNIGIGVADPDSPLEIYHSTDAQIKLSINTHGDAGIMNGNADGLMIYGKGASNQVRLYSNTTERLRVDSAGVDITGTLSITGYSDVASAITSLTSGGISKSGTPVDNQVAVFTSANQVEGSSNLTFASNVLAVDGDMTVTGTITAQEFKTEFVSSSIVFESGSTIFGNSTDDTHTFTGNVNISGSSTSSLFTVDGTQGRLFGVTDELSGSLFSANTISGLPVIEAFSDNKVTLGPYSSPVEVTNVGNLLLKNNKVISFEDSSGTSRGVFRINSSNRTAIGDTTAGEVITITGGDVGIGTTNPDYTLDVAGNMGIDGVIVHNGDADTYIQFGTNLISFYTGNSGNESNVQITRNLLHISASASTPTQDILIVDNTVKNRALHLGLTDGNSSIQAKLTNGTTNKLLIQPSGSATEFGGYVTVANGDQNTPSIRFAAESDTGIARFGGDTVGFISNSTPVLATSARGNYEIHFRSTAKVGWQSDGNLSANSPDTYLERASAGVISTNSNITGSSSSIGSFGIVRTADGSAATPAYSFNSDTNTGFYSKGAEQIGVTLTGVRRFWFQIDTFRSDSGPGMMNEAPSATNPVFITGMADTTTGLGGASNTLALIIGGASKLSVDSSGLATMTGFLTTGASYVSTRGVITHASGEFIIRSTSNNVLSLGSNGSNDHLVIDDGTVGIGTTNPGHGQSTPISGVKLDVAGNQMLSSTSTTNSDQAKLFFFRSDGAVGSQSDIAHNTQLGAIEWTGLVSADDNNSISAARIDVRANGLWNSAANRNADLHFSTINANTLAERMTIRYDGNVGIGTDSPSSKLQIQGGGIIVSGSNDTSPIQAMLVKTSAASSQGLIGVEGDTAGTFITNTLARATVLASSANSTALQLGASGNVKMTILGTANGQNHVGIGTTAPITSGQRTSLHLYGNSYGLNTVLKVEQDGAASSALIQIDSAADRDSSIQFQENGVTKATIGNDASNDALVLTDGSNTNLLYLKGGKVAIATGSASHELTIHDSSQWNGTPELRFSIATGVANEFLLGGIELKRDGVSSYNSQLEFKTSVYSNNVSTKMTIKSSGRVGIGTTSPMSQSLHITGAAGSDSQLRLSSNETNDTNKTLGIVASQYDSAEEHEGYTVVQSFSNDTGNRIDIGGGHSYRNAATSIRFMTAANITTRTGTERMVIDSSGRVGINEETPDAMLELRAQTGLSSTAIDAHGAVKFRTTVNDSSELRHLFNMGGASDAGSYVIYQGDATTAGAIISAGDDSYLADDLGLGVATPLGRLHLKSKSSSPSASIAIQHSGNTVNIVEIGQSDNGNGGGAIVMDKASGLKSIHIDAHGASRFNGGNVGFGTEVDPDTTIHMRETNDVYLTLESQNTGVTKEVAIKYQNYSTGTDFWWAGLNQSDDYSLAYGSVFSGANVKFAVLSSGNVGIGTDAPNTLLSVSAGTSGDVVPILSLQGHRTGNHPYAKLSFWHGSDEDTAYIMAHRANSNDSSADITFNTADNGTNAEVMRVTYDNKVGIGTASPDGELHIHPNSAGSVTAAGEGNNFIIEDSATPGMSILFPNNSKGSIMFGCPADNDQFTIVADTNNGRYSFSAKHVSHTMEFNVGGTQNLKLSGGSGVEEALFTGNVGIGGTPIDKLDIHGGNARVRVGGTGAVILQNDGSNNAEIVGVNNSSNTTVQLKTDGISYLRGGDVGIGTTSPEAKLHVQQTSSDYALHLDMSTNTTNHSNGLFIAGVDENSTSFPLFIKTNSSTLDESAGNMRFVVRADGMVGIGTKTPERHLHIHGSTSDYIAKFESQDASAEIIFEDNNSTNDGNRIGVTGNLMRIATNNSYRFYIDADGGTKVYVALAVGGITPSTTTGRIDAANDVVAYSTSDERLKENVKLIENPIDKVKKIRGVEFDWKPLTDDEKRDIHGNEGHDVGVIAQDVEKVLPEVVTERENGYKAVKYEKMVSLLIEGMKEQQKQIEELKSEIQELKDGSSK